MPVRSATSFRSLASRSCSYIDDRLLLALAMQACNVVFSTPDVIHPELTDCYIMLPIASFTTLIVAETNMYVFYAKQAEAERAARQALEDHTQIQRASILKDPYASLVLNRQTGLLSPQLRANPGSIWVQYATSRQCLDISKHERRLPVCPENDNVITAVLKDEATGTVFEGYHRQIHPDGETLSCVESVTLSLLSNKMSFPAFANIWPHRSWPPRPLQLQEDEYPIVSHRPLFYRHDTEVGSIFGLGKPALY